MYCINKATPCWMIALTVTAVIALTSFSVWFYCAERRILSQKVADQLAAVGKLKAEEISRWRAERIANAAVMGESPFLQQGLSQFLTEPNVTNTEAVLVRFRSVNLHYSYDDILLVDLDGRCRLSLSGNLAFDPAHQAVIDEAIRKRKPVLTDIHQEAGRGGPHIGVVTPIFSGAGPDAPPVCTIIMISNASQLLYPLIQSWPIPGKTAETLLVRREGDDVLFLNNLLQRKDAALNLRIPLTQKTVPAVKAVTGVEGIVAGLDYRGVEVLAYVGPVPNSPWFIVAKQDRTEILSEWRFLSAMILFGFVALAMFIVATAFAFWQRNKKAHYQVLYDYESKLRESAERNSITLKAIGDAVIATDKQGRVEFMNPVAEALTEWKIETAVGRPLGEIFHIVNEQTRTEVESPVERSLREGAIVGLANHTVLIGKNGTECPIADSAAPIFNDAGQILGVVLVFRDQTMEHNYKVLFEKMQGAFATHEIICDDAGNPVDYRFVDVNPAFEKMTGLKARDIVGKTVLTVLPGTERHWIETYGKVVLTGESVDFMNYSAALDKSFKVTAFRCAPNRFATIFMDITAIKSVEDKLARQNDELRRFNQLATGRELRMVELKKQVNELSARLGEPCPYPLEFLSGDNHSAI